MHQRDYILKYFEKLGIIMGILLGLKKEGKIEEALAEIDEAFKEMLNLDMNFIYQISEEEIVDQLVKEKRLDLEQINMISELLYEKIMILEMKNEKNLVIALSKKLLKIYDYLEDKEKTFSFDRMNKIEKIKSRKS